MVPGSLCKPRGVTWHVSRQGCTDYLLGGDFPNFSFGGSGITRFIFWVQNIWLYFLGELRRLKSSQVFLCPVSGVTKYLALSINAFCQRFRENSIMYLYVITKHAYIPGKHLIIIQNSLRMLTFHIRV